MLPWKLRKRHILPANQHLLSVHFSLAKFQLLSCNLSLAMIWQRTYTHKLPKLCSATLIACLMFHSIFDLLLNTCSWEFFTHQQIQSNLAISNSVNSKSPLFRRKIEFPRIYPYVFSHLLSAISNSVISNSPLFRTHRSFPTTLNQPRYFELVKNRVRK